MGKAQQKGKAIMAIYRPRKGLHWFDTLANIRCAANLSRVQLAAQVGVDRSTIWRVETGESQPSQALVDAYGKLANQQRR